MATAFMIIADSAQEVGTGSTSTATGLGTVVYDDVAVTATYSFSVTGLDFGELLNGGVADTADPNDDVTLMHFHSAARGANGGVAYDLLPLAVTDDDDDFTFSANNGGTRSFNGVWETTDTANTSLNTFAAALAGAVPGNDVNLYLNIHSAQFGGGAIRGQWVCIADDNANNVTGTAGADNLPGLDGNDTIRGAAGADTLAGGDGTDQVSYNGSAAGVTVNLAANTASGGDAAGDVISGFEGAAGSEQADNFTGTNGANSFFGNGGNDTMNGGLGNDTMDGGAGTDSMTGGTGNDTYVVDVAADKTIEAAGADYDFVQTALNTYTLQANMEQVNFTGAGNFVGVGNAGDNRFVGGAGIDRFVTSAGSDTYGGGSGTDSVDYRTSATGAILDFAGVHAGAAAGDTFGSIEKFFGSNTAADDMTGSGVGRFNFSGFGGNDTLTGSTNIDAINGGTGNDSLNGGAGVDTIQGEEGNDTMFGGAAGDFFLFIGTSTGNDEIMDFADGADRLKVHSSLANDISDFIIAGNGSTHVHIELVGDPGVSFALDSAAVINITAADFVFF
jgi:Ca2+-binding RTX toxin-like protein